MLKLSCFFIFLFAAEPAVNLTIPGLAAEADDEEGLDADDADDAAAGLAEVSEAEDPEAGRDGPLGLETVLVLDFALLPP